MSESSGMILLGISATGSCPSHHLLCPIVCLSLHYSTWVSSSDIVRVKNRWEWVKLQNGNQINSAESSKIGYLLLILKSSECNFSSLLVLILLHQRRVPCFIDLPSDESASSQCLSSPSPSLRPLSLLIFIITYFFHNNFFFNNFFTTNWFVTRSFSARQMPVYCFPTDIPRSYYWSSIYQILFEYQTINVAQVSFGEAAKSFGRPPVVPSTPRSMSGTKIGQKFCTCLSTVLIKIGWKACGRDKNPRSKRGVWTNLWKSCSANPDKNQQKCLDRNAKFGHFLGSSLCRDNPGSRIDLLDISICCISIR